MKKTILVFAGYYLPGYIAGGALRSISNLTKLMSEYFNFKIIALNRDFKCDKPYANVKTNNWNDVNNTEVFYTDHDTPIRKVINDTKFDMYYLNSFFSYNFSIKVILLRRLGMIPGRKLILAPRGELGSGALSFKRTKKKFYIFISKLFGLHKDVEWHASTETEAQHIKNIFGEKIKYKIALDVPELELLRTEPKNRHIKQKGKLRILFLSVINRVKNLKFVLEVLSKVRGDVSLDIYGPVKDEKYWDECSDLINKISTAVITYKGIAEHSRIAEIYPDYDIFFLPTLSENFGHVIYESLALGCPVLTSNNVFWTDLEKNKAGWNYDIKDQNKFVSLIETLAGLEEKEFKDLTSNCRGYLNSRININDLIKSNQMLFEN